MAFPTAAAHAAASIPEFSDENENGKIGYQQVAMLRKEAEKGNCNAMHLLARKFLLGIGIEEELLEGMNWLKELKDRCDPFASLVLRGLIFLNYAEKRGDKILAEGFFLRAADKGSTLALHCLARMYSMGNGVESSREKAIAFYRKAIELGDIQAEISLKRLLKHKDSLNFLS